MQGWFYRFLTYKSSNLKIFKFIFSGLLIFLILIVANQFVINVKYFFPPVKPFTGDKLYNPYYGMDSTKWKRANFHLHTRQLFGLTAGAANSVQFADSFYNYFDYDIYSISNYMRINTPPGTPNIYIPAYEHGYQYYKTHQLVLNARSVSWVDYFFRQTLDNKQFIIDRLKEDTSALVTIVHPEYRGAYSYSDFKFLANYDCIEVVNRVSHFVRFYDMALSSGHAVFILADDDAHTLSSIYDGAHSFNMINADREKNSVLYSLKTGKSYGVNLNLRYCRTNIGKKAAIQRLPVLTGVETTDDKLTVRLNQITDSIIFIGQNGTVKAKVFSSRSGSYTFDKDDTYIRTEIVCRDGSVLYLNPVFRYDGNNIRSDTPSVNVMKTLIYRVSFLVLTLLIIVSVIKYKSCIMARK